MTDDRRHDDVVDDLSQLAGDDARIAEGLREEIDRDRATVAALRTYLRRRRPDGQGPLPG